MTDDAEDVIVCAGVAEKGPGGLLSPKSGGPPDPQGTPPQRSLILGPSEGFCPGLQKAPRSPASHLPAAGPAQTEPDGVNVQKDVIQAGYSAKTAHRSGPENMQKPVIRNLTKPVIRAGYSAKRTHANVSRVMGKEGIQAKIAAGRETGQVIQILRTKPPATRPCGHG